MLVNFSGRDQIPRHKVRSQLPKELAEVILPLLDEGWALVPGGHKFKLLCPCTPGPEAGVITVNGTPKNPSTAAQQVKRKASRCPERHELM